MPYDNEEEWSYWTKARRGELPEPWGEPGDRQTASDGTEYELTVRTVALDPLTQQVTGEIRGSIWRDGRLIEQDEREITMTCYFTNELVLMLDRAGFSDVALTGDYTDESPTGDTGFVVFTARRAGRATT